MIGVGGEQQTKRLTSERAHWLITDRLQSFATGHLSQLDTAACFSDVGVYISRCENTGVS